MFIQVVAFRQENYFRFKIIVRNSFRNPIVALIKVETHCRDVYKKNVQN
jgi:hypothetical protein